LVSSNDGVEYALISPSVGGLSVCLADLGKMKLGGGCVELGPTFCDGQVYGDWVESRSGKGGRCITIQSWKTIEQFRVSSLISFCPTQQAFEENECIPDGYGYVNAEPITMISSVLSIYSYAHKFSSRRVHHRMVNSQSSDHNPV